jgi:hypothetical protein
VVSGNRSLINVALTLSMNIPAMKVYHTAYSIGPNKCGSAMCSSAMVSNKVSDKTSDNPHSDKHDSDKCDLT